MIVGIGILIIWLFAIPIFAGEMLVGAVYDQPGSGEGRAKREAAYRLGRILFAWVSGQMLLWAGFQILCVPLILKQDTFHKVVILFVGYTAVVLCLAAIQRLCQKKSKPQRSWHIVSTGRTKERRALVVLWGIVGGLLCFQMVQALRLSYADWDDAFYVALSSITVDADTMYQKLPYTGGATGLDMRHGLAPFPMWIAFLARISGIRAVTVARTILPAVLILMTYAIYYLISLRLYGGKRKKQLLFLLFTEILVIFGNYSIYSVENFLIARSRQGKAALGNIIVPFLFLLLWLLLERIEKQEKSSFLYWVLLLAVMLTACLCSTMGAALACLLLGVAGGCIVVAYRRWKLLAPFMLCCMPGMLFLVLYFYLR